jgi:protein TonB
MLLIAGAHVAVIAIAMSVKMVFPDTPPEPPIVITQIPIQQPPPPRPQPKSTNQPTRSTIDRIVAQVPTPIANPVELTFDPIPVRESSAVVGPSVIPEPLPLPQPAVDPVSTGPRLATSGNALRPPYPQSKLDTQQEAALRLKLSIDDRGRVVWVEPVGPADPAFLNAARKHLIARWRYQPATEGGRAVASSTVITLRFELEG